MNSLRKKLHQFIEAWQQGLPVACNSKGEWFIEGCGRRLIRQLLGSDQDRIIGIARALVQELDSLESTPIRLNSEQEGPFELMLTAADLVLSRLAIVCTQESVLASSALSRRVIGLRYRLEAVNGGFDRVAPDVSDNATLRQMVREWKERQPLIATKELTSEELERIQEIVTYPHFANMLASDENLREQFFTWTIRDKNNPSIFIQFPAMQEKLVMTNLSGRIGRINGQFLQIQKAKVGNIITKIVTLRFEGVDVNILDENNVFTFRGNYALSIAQVFRIFSEKMAFAGNLEFMADGIINWNYMKMGWWNAELNRFEQVDVNKNGWWKLLPAFEVLSLQQAQEKFGAHVDGKCWNIAASASRGTATLDYERTHAYLDIAIPMGNGNYAIFDFGKIANEFPTNFKETLQMFAKNVHASVAYPDESVYYTHREHTYYSIPMNPEQAMSCMVSIARDIIISRENHFVYQIESDNCAKWAQEKITAGIGEDAIPNLFQMHLLATEPFGPVAYIFSAIKKLPKSLRTFVLTRLHLPLGAGKGTWIQENGEHVFKSLSNHDFFETGIVYLPAFLHRQKEMGLIGNVIDCYERIIHNAVQKIAAPFIRLMQQFNFMSLVKIDTEHTIPYKKPKVGMRLQRILIPQFRE